MTYVIARWTMGTREDVTGRSQLVCGLLINHSVLASLTLSSSRKRRSLNHIVRLDVFLFSSRRRHTRLVSDWSSDVCSSDLPSASGRSNGNRLVSASALIKKITNETDSGTMNQACAVCCCTITCDSVTLPASSKIGRASCRERG